MPPMAQAGTLARITDIAEDQWGLLTRRQATDAGIPPATVNRLAAGNAVLKRVAHGVYRLAGAPQPEHQDLRAAWLQLAPAVRGWERDPREGVVSHRSAADMYGLGHLSEDRHEFTVARRRQSRRADVRLHHRPVTEKEWIVLRGLPVTRPARIASDLLYDREDPTAVAHIIGDALRGAYEYPGTTADALDPHAARFGLRRGDGLALLHWLLDLLDDPDSERWMSSARADAQSLAGTKHAPALVGGVASR
jgi:hypothetical protein